MDGDFTQEQFAQIHYAAVKNSPKRWNITNTIRLDPRLMPLGAITTVSAGAD